MTAPRPSGRRRPRVNCIAGAAYAGVTCSAVTAAPADGNVLAATAATVTPRWPTDPPAYPFFPGRTVRVLNGTWDFAFLGEDIPMVPSVPDPPEWQQVSVPDAFDLRPNQPRCSECWPPGKEGDAQCQVCCNRAWGVFGDDECWGTDAARPGHPPLSFDRCCGQDPLYLRRGVAAYRTHVEVPPGSAAILHFAACTLRCLVAVDGVFVGDHAGLSPFWVTAAAASKPDQVIRTVLVLADNRFNKVTHPVHQPRYDWYQAGGIIRAVQYHALPTSDLLYLSSVEVFPRSSQVVDVVVRTSTPPTLVAKTLVYHWRFDDENTAATSCHVGAGWGKLDPAFGLRSVEVPDAKPWSPEHPALHRLKVALVDAVSGGLLDCVEVRFGMRVVEARGREILLNGEAVKLIGFNRHDLTTSPVLSYTDLVRDVALLQLAGANFVRGAHYAQDQRFLDMCDMRGIFVWEEVLGWQNTPADFSDGVFMMQMLRMADELASASVNHPSVVFFAFFNEGHSFDTGRATSDAYEMMATRLRDRSGGTRLISWGSNAGVSDNQLHNADVCAFHDYTAWYPTTRPVDLDEVQQIPYLYEANARWVEDHHPGKPFLVTEAGAAGLLGKHGPSNVKWTEEYQSLLFQMHLLSVLQNPKVVGISLWQFADIPVDQNFFPPVDRPRGLNNKGFVGLGRQPKAAFQAVRLLMEEQRKPFPYVGLILPEEDAELIGGVLRL
eukprot:TRINITY_DN67006_c0_g1_i1.p1 TRINITY_DN67006_c0_g1~~TRINITY_DN67006_c0_g1_i1.p1  ORF type:complete len:768 (+),score=92.86 TRINITY_DN67006_c0_g1_i1:146-2305(+)